MQRCLSLIGSLFGSGVTGSPCANCVFVSACSNRFDQKVGQPSVFAKNFQRQNFRDQSNVP